MPAPDGSATPLCPTCAGTKVIYTDLGTFPTTSSRTPCPTCTDGKGDMVLDDRCPDCHFPGRPEECASGCTKGYGSEDMPEPMTDGAFARRLMGLDVSGDTPDGPGSRFENPDPEWWAWHPMGWEEASEGSIRRAANTTRGQAAAYFAREGADDLTRVRVWKRYARPLSWLDVWEKGYGEGWWEDRWCQEYADAHDGNDPYDDGVDVPEYPAAPPPEWQPDEYDPVWEFVHRSHPQAIAIWVCGMKGDKPPFNPPKEAAHA